MPRFTSEKDHAVALANKILNRSNGDPDDDLAMLSRQLLRALERSGTPSEAPMVRILRLTEEIALSLGIRSDRT